MKHYVADSNKGKVHVFISNKGNGKRYRVYKEGLLCDLNTFSHARMISDNDGLLKLGFIEINKGSMEEIK